MNESISIYEKILKLYRGDIDALVGLARVYGWKSDFGRAKMYADSALKLYPENPEVYAICGEISLYQDDLKNALKLYKKAFMVEPNKEEYAYKIAEIYEWLEDYDEAIHYAMKTLRINPNHTEAKNMLDRIKKLRSFALDAAINTTVEEETLATGVYKIFRIGLERRISKLVRVSVATKLTYNSRGNKSRNYSFITPTVRFSSFRFLLLRLSGDLCINERSMNGFGASIELTKTPAKVSFAFLREVLEPVNEIIIDHIELRLQFRWRIIEIKGTLDKGFVFNDENSRVITDITTLLHIMRKAMSVKVFHSFSVMDYDNWSPYYYSPEELVRHSLGAIVMKSLGKFYLYADFSASVWSSAIAVSTASFEAGYSNYFMSISYFTTSENYTFINLKAGVKIVLPF